VDLESYTNGVLSAEMPVTSPLEALKAQAVVARTQALYIKNVGRPHHRNGYDICDGQHCQVYLGVQAENERSRSVVEATRGRIVAYHGRPADVIYSSNCGGHTQSGSELNGWGRVPYWKGIEDMPPGSPPYPHSPWELRWWLRSEPPAYCMPSSYVYPSHYRWTRVVSAQELAARIDRSVNIGKILGVLTLRRAVSGHINSARILGSRRNLYLKDESRIRNLLAPGSQRSALFFVETEYGPDHRPSAFVFHGAGWGHGVGMCQSGAAGRAERGSLYEDILKAYYPGTDIGDLRY
jgi:SpoIID/LytB domain protein